MKRGKQSFLLLSSKLEEKRFIVFILFGLLLILSVSLITAADIPCPSEANKVTKNIDAYDFWGIDPWRDTGIQVTAGDTLRITSPTSKSVRYSSGWCIFKQVNANGITQTAGGDYLVGGVKKYSMVGKIGSSGTPFFVGIDKTLTATASGKLYLAMNDVPVNVLDLLSCYYTFSCSHGYSDNCGSFPATVYCSNVGGCSTSGDCPVVDYRQCEGNSSVHYTRYCNNTVCGSIEDSRINCTLSEEVCNPEDGECTISPQSTSCGNGVQQDLNGDGKVEQCDGTDLNGQTCVNLGWEGGTLACNSTCGFDTSSCTGPQADAFWSVNRVSIVEELSTIP